jgi:hypothetical protein
MKTRIFEQDRYSLSELARILKVHISTLHRWRQPPGVAGKTLECIRLGGRWYVLASDLEAFLEGKESGRPATSKAEETNRRAQERLRSYGFTKKEGHKNEKI